MAENKLTFIVPVTKDQVLADNVLKSKVYRDGVHRFVFQRGYTNVAKAYNDASKGAEDGILVFCHQDVFFPEAWEQDFCDSLDAVDKVDPDWGVLGAAGVVLCPRLFGLRCGVEFVGNFSTNVAGGSYVIDHLHPKSYPQQVHTLDEFLLIVRKADARFDEDIPNNHFYGADLCLSCDSKGRRSYAISAYTHHASTSKWVFGDFYESAAYIYRKYRSRLPIATTCVVIDERDGKSRFFQDPAAIMAMTIRSLLKRPKRVTRSRRPM